MTEREFAMAVVRRLHEAGHQALWAGGCVRDELLGLEPDDFDVASDARPEEVSRLFRRTLSIGASFGVVEVLGPPPDPPLHVQVATFRSDGNYLDGRRPEQVRFSSAEEDARRRDFTINGLFFDPLEQKLIDFVGGQADLDARVLRAIGDPLERFREDKLRLLRGVRMATRFDMEIEPATLRAIKKMAPEIVVVSAERIADELKKILALPTRARGMRLMMEVGLAAAILSELVPLRGLPQGLRSDGGGDFWEHVLQVIERLEPQASFTLALSALVHAIGNPRSLAGSPDCDTGLSNKQLGRRLAGEICLRLKLSTAERERIEWLVEKQAFLLAPEKMRLSKLKRTLAHPGIRELLALHRAEALASGSGIEHVVYCERLLEQWSPTDLNPPVLITGHDVEALGLPPGPRFKELLESVREAQLDGTVTTREQGLEMLRTLNSARN